MSIPGKEVQNGVYEFDYMRAPDTRTKKQIFLDALYNPTTKAILGHTKREWGMGYRPLPASITREMIISYDSKNVTDMNSWIKRINTFLESYHNSSLLPGGGRNQQICDYNQPPRTGKVCMFDVDNLGPCSYDKGYGFVHSQPCVFIKLNKIFGWIPDHYNDSKDFPSHMPQSVKSHIENNINSGRSKTVWVSCKAVREKDALIEQVKYYPEVQGFPGYYYPYENQEGYLSPLVAVQFIKFQTNTTINVECQAWAKNTRSGNQSEDKAYRVRFSLRVNV
ncbi:sodium/potassium-transporting ATPase subunit beta-2-like isoform X2 [Belonocnema kinseyi]|uniref:sodium/potassium-transporting ATPase subunit beta-2-like isoform X2 n=1 Tax=Belonocnema kinseyi TaxID=2817044 RepID=UPI00143D274B|nr:sodium/potassium-transporting ATPase subunit beta-2-like isoform X2 [Belonocnema kinseyi]